MWRTQIERARSAKERLRLAHAVWGWRPHAAQRRFFCCPAQVRVAACGRRWGKTESLSIDIATLAITQARAGEDCRQLVVAPTDYQARLLGNDVLSRLLAAFDADTEWTRGLALDVRQRPALQITVYPEGGDVRRISNDKKAHQKGAAISRLLFRSAARDGASLRGLWAHRIVVDEASRVPDLVMTEVLLPMLMDVGGDYVLASSPFGRRSAFFRLWEKGTPTPPSSGTPPPEDRERGQGQSAAGASRGGQGRKAAGASQGGEWGVSFASFQCPTADNPHNDRALLASMRDEMGDAVYAQEILAEFTEDAGAVFREDEIVACLEADPRVELAHGELVSAPAPGRIYAAGIDWGRRVDFTVLAILDATERPARLVHLRRWTGTGWNAQLAAIADDIARFTPLKVLCDGNAIGDPLVGTLTDAVREAQSRRGQDDPPGISIDRFVFTADSKLQLVDRLTIGLSRRGLRYPHHAALLSELRGFEYGAVGATGRARMAARGSGHDDIVMALALAWWCAPEGAPEPLASQVLLGSSLGIRRR